MLASLWTITLLVASGLAAPRLPIKLSARSSSNASACGLPEFYSTVSKYINAGKHSGLFKSTPSCDLTVAQNSMPTVSGLPAPSSTQKLYHVAIGRGTQNYTCDTATPSATPVAAGAVARLYNSTCTAATSAAQKDLKLNLLGSLTNTCLTCFEPTSDTETLPPFNLQLSGHHYFTSDNVPSFDLGEYGLIHATKSASVAAPSGSYAGLGNEGAVAWLYLAGKSDNVNGVTGVYRVNTAGGSPPKTCEGQPAAFDVQYAAEYWFYTG